MLLPDVQVLARKEPVSKALLLLVLPASSWQRLSSSLLASLLLLSLLPASWLLLSLLPASWLLLSLQLASS